MTTLYLALGGHIGHQRDSFCKPPNPAVLCSYVYYDVFKSTVLDTVNIRHWVLDSGAYSAFNSGRTIGIQEYIDFCKQVADGPRPPQEVFALDVIGDWKASMVNTEEMWRQGVPAIPCYHVGEPKDVLLGMARDYPKIAIGGTAGRMFGDKRLHFLEQCFAHIWPKKVHGFGVTNIKLLRSLPFHSVDSTSWEIGALRFGNWAAYADMPVKGPRSNHYLRPEVDVYMDIEAQLKARWSKQMAELESLP